MSFATRSGWAIPTLLLALASSAGAATVQPQIDPRNLPEAAQRTSAACQVGELRTGSIGAFPMLVAGREFMQLVDPTLCTACPTQNGIILSNAFLRIRFRAAASVTLEISLLEAGGTAACPVPDRATVICGANLVTLSQNGAVATADYALPLGNSCCITHKVFLRVRVVSVSDANQLIVAHADPPCLPCSSYVFDTAFGGLFDECAAFGWNTKIWADADCCAPTSTHSSTWGRVRSIYR